MKRKTVNVLLAVALAASMGLSAPAVMAAGEESVQTGETAGETDAAAAGSETGTDAAAAGSEADAAAGTDAAEKVPEDVKVTLDSGEVTIVNKAEIVFAGASCEKAPAGEAGGTQAWNLVLTEDGEEGTVHTFENVSPDQWTEPVLTEEFGFLYITYKTAAGAEEEVVETALEKELEEPVTVYATTDVNVREAAGTDSKSLKVTSLGTEWKAVAAAPGWIKVEGNGITGYIFHKYVTDDKEEVDALVKKAQEAAAAAAAAAAAQAQAAAQQQYTEPEVPVTQPETVPEPEPEPEVTDDAGPEEVYEVSRQKYDDCDGSGHGYWEIVYSDGSVSYEEY